MQPQQMLESVLSACPQVTQEDAVLGTCRGNHRLGEDYAASSFTPAMNSRSVFLASPSTIIVFG